jgi:hypothetical protein
MVVDSADGRLGVEHRCGELFKRRYSKQSVNHGDPTFFAPVVKNQVPNVDNPADFALGFKNQAPSVDDLSDLLRFYVFFAPIDLPS